MNLALNHGEWNTSEMMSAEDRSLLVKHRAELMDSIDLEGSSLLDQLLQRTALNSQQVDIIKVDSHRHLSHTY